MRDAFDDQLSDMREVVEPLEPAASESARSLAAGARAISAADTSRR